MKTQLLEDIGQSAGLPPAPSKAVEHSRAGNVAQGSAAAAKAETARRRIASGVWRKKPAGEPPASTTQQVEEPAPVALDSVFEELAALEAQFVQPGQPDAPAMAQVEPEHDVPAAPAEPLPAPVSLPDDDRTAPNPIRSVAAPHGPLFYFTQPLPASHEADPFTPVPTGPTRFRPRYLLGAAGALSIALLILGGRWLYQERNDAGSIALIAAEWKEQVRADMAVKARAAAKRESAPEPGAETLAQAAIPSSSPLPAVPPLVMLEPDPPAAIQSPPAQPSAATARARRLAQKSEPAAEQRNDTRSPKTIRKARAPSRAADRPAKERPKREPIRQLARASALPTEKPAADTSMAATLRACREHGYHATQCIKRECSITAYGFACRGR